MVQSMKVWALCAAAAVATANAETPEGVGVEIDGEVEAFDWHRDERLQGRALEATAEFYHTQELPMYTEFLENCQTDISQHCNPHSGGQGYMNEWWSCLEETDFADLLPKCKQFLKFGHNGANPNPAFFEKVFDCKDINNLDLGLTQPLSTNCFVGYLKAPLFQGQPASSPITQTWYLVVPATTQPAPKGMLVQHNGGPMPGIGSNIFMAAADESTKSRIFGFPADAAYINANYDVVFTDLRGMGLSALRYKMNLDPAAIPKRDFFLTYLNLENTELGLKIGSDPAFNDKDVHMYVQQVGKEPVNIMTFSARCADLVYPAAPTDWTSLSLVNQFTEAHGQYLAACTKKNTFPDGLGGTYTTFQYWGTSAAAWDLESLRQAFGSPDITLMGYSYGTRYVAAYASSFPKKIVRAVVTGTVNPSPDATVVADYTAANTENIFNYVAGQCKLSDDCDVDVMNLATAAYAMSLDESAGFQSKCCGFASQAVLAGMYRPFLVADPQSGLTYPNGTYQDGFPVNFGILPWAIGAFAGDAVCKYTALPGSEGGQATSPNTMYLIPSLDMVGRTDPYTLAQRLVAVATKNPIGIDMALQYMQSTYGWRTEPVPIGFANNDVPFLIANTLYDERTSIENAQMYRTNFANSRIITAQAGGHCISAQNSNECNNLMADFLLGRSEPQDGYVCENRGTIDFTAGKALWESSAMSAQFQALTPPVCKKCKTFKTAKSCNTKKHCRWNSQMRRCLKKK